MPLDLNFLPRSPSLLAGVPEEGILPGTMLPGLEFAAGTGSSLGALNQTSPLSWSSSSPAALCLSICLRSAAVGLNGILAFWLAYIVTRPLGASIGDYLSQGRDVGGLGLGSTALNAVFLCSILAVVAYLTVSRRDQVRVTEPS